jgi:Flp pilus assembly pilin Flp
MSKIHEVWRRFLRDDRGQSTTEYILILSVVVMVAMKFKQTFQGKLTGIVDQLGGKIEQGMNDMN